MTEQNNQSSKDSAQRQQAAATSRWGPRLFIAVLVGILAFFYWLLIYAGGVTVHQG